jgi:DNA modification methylase
MGIGMKAGAYSPLWSHQDRESWLGECGISHSERFPQMPALVEDRTFPSLWGKEPAGPARSVIRLAPTLLRGESDLAPLTKRRRRCHPLVKTTRYPLKPLSTIKGNPNNAREHNPKQLAKLARSIQKFGFITPIVVDETGALLCGHARLLAARQLKIQAVPAVRANHLGESQKRAFVLADNRLAELSSWNPKSLKRELQFLSELEINYDFLALGFETAEIDFVFADDDEADDRANALSQTLDVPTISRPGDLWQLDQHRVFCGSALETASYQRLLAHDRAQMVFTDLSYKMPIQRHAGGRGGVKHREFAMASGEMTNAQFTQLLSTALTQIKAFTDDGAICFVCINWRHIQQFLTAAAAFTLENICVWVKNNGGMGSLYQSQHEFVVVLKGGAADHINNVEFGKHGRNRTNLWEYRGINSLGHDRDELLTAHHTVKPVALVADAIKDCSRRGHLILDPFGALGTTMIAAEKTKRRAALIELDPGYVDTIVRRWQAFSGKDAVCANTGATFAHREGVVKTAQIETHGLATEDKEARR